MASVSPAHPLRTVVIAPTQARTAELVAVLRDSAHVTVVDAVCSLSQFLALRTTPQPDLVVMAVERDAPPPRTVPNQAADAFPPLVVCGRERATAALAYELGAVDFWLAGRERESLPRTLARVRQRAWARTVSQPDENSDGDTAHDRRRIALRSDGMMVLVDPQSIRRLEAIGNYVRVVHASGATVVRCTLEALTAQLGDRFIRVHRSHAVALDRIRALQTSRSVRLVVMADGTTTPLGRRYAPLVEEQLCRGIPSLRPSSAPASGGSRQPYASLSTTIGSVRPAARAGR